MAGHITAAVRHFIAGKTNDLRTSMPSLDLSPRNEVRFHRRRRDVNRTLANTLISVFHPVKLELCRRWSRYLIKGHMNSRIARESRAQRELLILLRAVPILSSNRDPRHGVQEAVNCYDSRSLILKYITRASRVFSFFLFFILDNKSV